MQGFQQLHGFEVAGNVFPLGNLSQGLSWRDEPHLLTARIGLRRQPVRVNRFGTGGTATLRLQWPSKMELRYWVILARALGNPVIGLETDIKADASPGQLPVNLLWQDASTGLAYRIKNAVAQDIRLNLNPVTVSILEIVYAFADLETGANFIGSESEDDRSPIVGCSGSVSLGAEPAELFDFQFQLSRSVFPAGRNASGVPSMFSVGDWSGQIQLGAYFEDDNLYGLSRQWVNRPISVALGSGPGSVLLSSPAVTLRPASPDIQANADGVIRLFLQPLMDDENCPTLRVI